MKSLCIPFTLIAGLNAQEVKLQAWQNHQILSVLEVADVANGVDATEARALAEAYFLRAEGSCGGLWSMRREGKWWIFETVVGPSAAEGQPIKIHVEAGWVCKKGAGEIIRPPWRSLRTWFAEYAKAQKEEGVTSEGGADKNPKNAEQGGAGHPAPASKPRDKENPQPASKPASR